MKLDILAIAAHPDDVELCCSGTLARHIELGAKVGVLDLTKGELGTRGTPEKRLEEAEKSRQILGLEIRKNCELPDGFFANNEESIRTIIPFIREYQPEIVITNVPEDRHPDHGRAAGLVRDACFYSGLIKIKTFDPLGNPHDRWRPRHLFHFLQDHYHTPDLIVDITDYWEKKMEAVRAFSSQFYNPDSNEPDSPISGKEFFAFLEARAREMGRLIETEFGEGFLISRPPGIDNLLDLR